MHITLHDCVTCCNMFISLYGNSLFRISILYFYPVPWPTKWIIRPCVY